MKERAMTLPELEEKWEYVRKAAVFTAWIRNARDADRLWEYYAQQCKENGRVILPEDLSEELSYILGEKTRNEDAAEAEKVRDAAVRCFGTTKIPSLAGYIATDGSYLCFSGDGLTRDRDHREIREAFELADVDCGDGYSDAMIRFMDMGNIRLGIRSVDVSVCPNERQWAPLIRFLRSCRATAYVDISARNTGKNIGTAEIPPYETHLVREYIQAFFSTGEMMHK